MNHFGNSLTLTTFGESHGIGVGGVLDGFPPAFKLDLDKIQEFVSLRRPGSVSFVSPRREKDTIEFLSGLLDDGTTTGAPIAFFIKNEDIDSSSYEVHSDLFRPSHADFTYYVKYHLMPQPGGGRASARETAVRCVAGAIASQWLAAKGLSIYSYVCQVGPIVLEDSTLTLADLQQTYQYASRCPHKAIDLEIQSAIKAIREEGDSLGGVISTRVINVPKGLGEPLYDKLSARLSFAMLSINAVKGFEVGDGFALASMRGSEANDEMEIDSMGNIRFRSNHSGGILGGISTGADLFFRVAFKPTPTISHKQHTISLEHHNAYIEGKGRHDPAVVIRAVPVVEAMTALVLADFLLQV